jgi:NitT/TauT family transport system substrate-binding protein
LSASGPVYPEQQLPEPLKGLLRLAARAPENVPVDDVALHFLTGIQGLNQMRTWIECPVHQLWAYAEELRLLFDANAVWIKTRPPQSVWCPSDAISEVASLTDEEKNLLKDLLWDVPNADWEAENCHKATWLRLRDGGTLSDRMKKLANNNLRNARSILKLSVNEAGSPWEIVLLLPGETDDIGKRRSAVKLCKWIFEDDKGTRCRALTAGLSTLPMPFGKPAARRESFWRMDREKFVKELMGLSVAKFIEKYKQRMKPMHEILTTMDRKFEQLFRENRDLARIDYRIIFSYRAPQENYIYFMPTDLQAEHFVQLPEDIEPFLAFCGFRYPHDRAISGWVLSTAMCDYTEEFLQDGRWQEWLREPDGQAKAQQDRVKKFLQSDAELRHLYLVPILMAPVQRCNGIRLETILMASISLASPLPVHARRKIFETATEMRPAVHMALVAQNNLEKALEKASEGIKAAIDQVRLLWIQAAILTVTIIAGIASTAYFHSKDHPSAPNNRFVLAQNPIPMAALTILASREGLFETHGLQVTTKQISSGRDALNAVLTGQAQFATVAETPLVLAAFADDKLAIIATIAESNKDMQFVVQSGRRHRLPNLKGAKIATDQDTNADYLMYAFLKKQGIDPYDPKQIQVWNMKPKDMVAAFEKGEISGYFSWQPYAQNGLALPRRHSLSYPGTDFYNMTFSVVTSRDFANKHPEQLKEFLQALRDAQDEVEQDPPRAKEVLMEETKMDEKTLNDLWPDYQFHLGLNDSLLNAMEEQRSWAKDEEGRRLVDKNPNFCTLLVPEALKGIEKHNERLVSLSRCGL